MKAIAQDGYGPPDVLMPREVDRPTIGDAEVLVQVRAAGVDPGVWIFMAGRPYAVRLAAGLRRPKVSVRGRAFAGVVAATGDGVTGFQPGDEVYGTTPRGTYAEYTAARADRMARKPANVTFDQAAAVPISAQTALQTVRDRCAVQAGQRVMVIGATGGVGSYAVQLAKAYGAAVTAVCGPGRAELARSIGADDVIDHTREEIDRDGPVYDVVIDTAGDRPLSLLRRALTPHGTLAIVGGSYRQGRLLGGVSRQMLRAPLLSMFVGQRLRNVTATERATDLTELTRLIESGAVTPVVDRVYPLAEASDALRHLTDGHPAGKLVVTVA
ncbi:MULTISPECIES: NAD(P)-dependent alcohol dehydrogenase [unclassified Pseudofrankia]|uniref:NAD(P)-dependent alcohol dehydrogenase n=1 Tax=unclassified Pseudofrankia TaxID=2994372 RepID=UPI0008DA41FC|nr:MULTISPECIES: NAD(P)-dependent alcohol dehydrogenase [unclassified Pseudofrankia]MDT3439373.1 NAD(P)-dependent alcohol dehydrogenase [Pseudofrankia sp. BMG5.37]OHV65041.1 NADPH:quinone reductase [Pseudofrankia sp. BMG5.36]